MTASETLDSLDRTLAEIRRTHSDEMKALTDQLLAAQIETSLCKKNLLAANTDRDYYLGIATKLITQFSTVEAVFAEAKELATHFTPPAKPQTDATAAIAAALSPIDEAEKAAEAAAATTHPNVPNAG